MIVYNLQIAISENNRVFIHYYTCIYAADIMVGIIQDKSAGIIWNVSARVMCRNISNDSASLLQVIKWETGETGQITPQEERAQQP